MLCKYIGSDHLASVAQDSSQAVSTLQEAAGNIWKRIKLLSTLKMQKHKATHM